MAVDVIGFEDLAVHDMASTPLKDMERLIRVFERESQAQLSDFTVSRLKNVVSALNRTGHARFRRGPAEQLVRTTTDDKPSSPVISGGSGSLQTPTAGNGSISERKDGQPIHLHTALSAGKPPLPSTYRKRCYRNHSSYEIPGRHSLSVSGGCHCSRNRKSRSKKVIKVVTVKSKVASIPADEYAWKKYGQKLIHGSPNLRGYYKCTSFRGCPARKHVERVGNDPMVLVITYRGEHRHAHHRLV